MCRYNSTSHGYLYLQHQWHDVVITARSSLFWCSVSLHLKTLSQLLLIPDMGSYSILYVCVCVVCVVRVYIWCVCVYVCDMFVCKSVYVHCEGCTEISSEETIMQPRAIFCRLKSWSQTHANTSTGILGCFVYGRFSVAMKYALLNFTRNFSLSSYPILLKAWAMGAYDEGPRTADLEHCFFRSVIAWAHWSFCA